MSTENAAHSTTIRRFELRRRNCYGEHSLVEWYTQGETHQLSAKDSCNTICPIKLMDPN